MGQISRQSWGGGQLMGRVVEIRDDALILQRELLRYKLL
jgi:hypothetical protein